MTQRSYDPDAMMRAVEITEAGGPDVLKATKRPIPTPKDHEILIKTAFAGVNRPDCLQRAGAYPPPKDASDLPGLEVSGTIAAIGKDVRSHAIGDQVCALTAGGGYAEYVVAPAAHSLPIPKGLSLEEAASLPENYFTVYSNLFMRAKLQPGESLLVHGGSSGIGTTAIQMASLFGIKTYTTAGSSEKCAYCLEQGAEAAINYREDNWAERLKDITKGQGVDVILDMVGGPYVNDGIKSLKLDGRYVFIAFLGGSKQDVNFMRVMTNRLTLTGSTLRPQSHDAKKAMADALQTRIWPHLATKQLKPHIFEIFELEEAHKAHSLMEGSTHMGKILLKVC